MEVAAGLTTIGVERGDFVALMMDNRVEHEIADQATLHAGGADDLVQHAGTRADPLVRRPLRRQGGHPRGPRRGQRWQEARDALPGSGTWCCSTAPTTSPTLLTDCRPDKQGNHCRPLTCGFGRPWQDSNLQPTD
jgi:hypothetical protein